MDVVVNCAGDSLEDGGCSVVVIVVMVTVCGGGDGDDEGSVELIKFVLETNTEMYLYQALCVRECSCSWPVLTSSSTLATAGWISSTPCAAVERSQLKVTFTIMGKTGSLKGWPTSLQNVRNSKGYIYCIYKKRTEQGKSW